MRKERRARPQGCFRGVGLLPERPSACRSQKHPLRLSKAAAAQWPAPHLAPQPLLNPAQAQPSAQRAAPHPSPSPVGASLWPQTPNSPPGSNTHKGRLRQVPLSPHCFTAKGRGWVLPHTLGRGKATEGKGTEYLSWEKWTGERENGRATAVRAGDLGPKPCFGALKQHLNSLGLVLRICQQGYAPSSQGGCWEGQDAGLAITGGVSRPGREAASLDLQGPPWLNMTSPGGAPRRGSGWLLGRAAAGARTPRSSAERQLMHPRGAGLPLPPAGRIRNPGPPPAWQVTDSGTRGGTSHCRQTVDQRTGPADGAGVSAGVKPAAPHKWHCSSGRGDAGVLISVFGRGRGRDSS